MEFRHPFTAIVAGPTGCGKTQFVLQFIRYANEIVNPPPQNIMWCYGAFQDVFRTVKNVEFHDGIPEIDTLKRRTLLILDDLMSEADERVNDIFTKHSHHKDVSVLFLSQNLFHKKSRTMTLNSHYLVLFKNPRDASQMSYLARQMYPGKSKFMIDAFADATAQPYSYLVVDLKADTEDKLRLRSGIFPGQTQFVYVQR
jgi:hypothetical protein